MKKYTLFFLLISVCSVNGFAQKNPKKGALQSFHQRAIVSYNVENLFDTIDDKGVIDEEFLPDGKLKWNSQRYQLKLDHLVEAITMNLTENPVIIGLVEIENAGVIKDLKNTGRLAKTKYEIAHKDSPDARGIDCGLLYDKERFKLIKMETLTVSIDSISDFKTRDILVVKGELQGGKIIYLFVNHWPSRRGGEGSEIRRIQAAKVARAKVDEILKADPKANIILMGDFNDHPNNISIQDVLKAKDVSDSSADLLDLFADDHKAGKGTHNYKNEWGVLDHFIVSRAIYSGSNGVALFPNDGIIVYEEKLLFTQKDGSKKPSTTYGGPNYYGGYSDHLPIQLILK
ncbi:endonuclease/exonuclease/phosphatase family protein [Fluviicola taffensis]|uniref:Endonuclease/exonuclease/phosphatase n=1 Tax=Fluviicola taffensis (strain DSM 16823 / NCIMB 13979 / RW262) TaxID=755732 RepID=F2IEF5_FLUTR|nr:endonuclease/exonuclease/phosphatase family protein [Fluviicola taffensis]AEA43479.1 Endonuclease/exonuclease/phosphatase [Fluviicola taffensis DSM 16823]